MTKVRVLTYCKRDHVVSERGSFITCYAGAHDTGSAKVAYTVGVNNRFIASSSSVPIANDLSARVPVDAYPISFKTDQTGDYVVSVRATNGYNTVSDSVTVTVFGLPDITVTVDSSVALRNALITAKSYGRGHCKIVVQPGNYSWPEITDPFFEAFDLRDTPMLVSVEAPSGGVVMSPSTLWLAHSHWLGIVWQGSADILTSVPEGCVATFASCSWIGPAGMGIYAATAYVRCDNCLFESLTTAATEVSVVRGCFIRNITGVVWSDVHRLIEGNAGYTFVTSDSENTSYGCWAKFSVVSAPWIRFNWITDYSRALVVNASSNTMSACVVGNVLSTTHSTGIALGNTSSSYVVQNTIESSASGASISSLDSTYDYVVNNWFSYLTSDSKKLYTSRWSNNATRSVVSNKNTISSVDPKWSNRFLIPSVDSPLLQFDSTPQSPTAFGVLKRGQEIGALPYLNDEAMASTIVDVVSLPALGVSSSDAFIGDVSALPSTGVLNFADGSQSGYLTVI